MRNARRTIKTASTLAAIFLTAAVFSPSEVTAAAGGIQNCATGTNCTIGEFLYDDNSVPIAGATCTITSKNPDLTTFLSAVTLSGGGADGWYYDTFATPSTLGMYPTTISCTVNSDTLSIDKSFQVAAPPATGSIANVDTNSIAAAVWGYSNRTVTSLQNVISDLWNGTITPPVGSPYTPSLDLSQIQKNTSETRLLMEKVVNKPVIENVLENSAPPIGDKLNGTRSMANQIYVNNQFLTSQSAALTSSWDSTDGKTLLNNVISLSNVIGSSSDTSDANTMFGQVNWINSSWNWDVSTNIYNQLVSMDKIMSDLKLGLANYNKTPAQYSEAKQLVADSLVLEKMVGTVADTSSSNSLFAKIQSTADLSSNLDDKENQINNVLTGLSKNEDTASVLSKITDLKNQVIALNKVQGAQNALVAVDPNDPNSIKNELLGLRGIVDSNKMLLSLGAGKTLLNTWLEVGSIIFKTLATNPSILVAQDVDIKYYLPQELKQADIIKSDPGLTVKYDTAKDQLFVEGTFNLNPGQTKTFQVETKDIWSITPEDIASLRNQADSMFTPLQKTSYFAQAVSLKSDINANLDQITSLEANVITPEDKIKAYRESVILKNSVDSELLAMKGLVGEASAQGNLLGFVGGSQTVAVWGIIVIVIAGFVFMTTYMKKIMSKEKVIEKEIKSDGKVSKKQIQVTHARINPAGFIVLMLVSSALSAAASGYVVNSIVSKNYQEKTTVLGTQTAAPAATPAASAPAPKLNDAIPSTQKNNSGTGGEYLVVVSDAIQGTLNVRSSPNGEILGKVKAGDKLPYIAEKSGWYQVTLEDGTTGWVSMDYSTKE